MRLRFGEYVMDAEARELRRGGVRVPLAPKALQLLTLLLESRPRALPHTELRDALWPATYVGYTSLAGVVREVRRAIGDTGGPSRLIRTVPRFGYAFSGKAEVDHGEPSPLPAAALVSAAREFPLSHGETLVGRGEECGVKLPSSQVSRVHARVCIAEGTATVEDLGSKNGTWVNGEKREGPTDLSDGDEVTFGTFRLLFRRGAGEGPTATGRPD
jgi:DNA-binding winged helix-turn-helix (wHTH) protein